MVQKYFLTALLLASVLVVSCRQDDEVPSEDLKTTNLAAKEEPSDIDQPSTYSRDSISVGITPTDPPKNGTHWRRSDSIGIVRETTDPPKNGTHWRGKD